MIVLPNPARHHWLLAFWLALSLATGVLVAVLLAILVSPGWISLALALVPALAAPALVWPQVASFPYRAWNKLGRYIGQILREFVLRVCFYTVFVAVRWGGFAKADSGLSGSGGESVWVVRGTLAPSDYIAPRYSGQIAEFISWVRTSRNLWALALLPSMVFLLLLETDRRRQKLPENIYTLF
jgi:hypothetical protein